MGQTLVAALQHGGVARLNLCCFHLLDPVLGVEVLLARLGAPQLAVVRLLHKDVCVCVRVCLCMYAEIYIYLYNICRGALCTWHYEGKRAVRELTIGQVTPDRRK